MQVTYSWKRLCFRCGAEDVRPSNSPFEFEPFSIRGVLGLRSRGIDMSPKRRSSGKDEEGQNRAS